MLSYQTVPQIDLNQTGTSSILVSMSSFDPAAMFVRKPISPLVEMGAYEWLWLQKGMTFKRMAELFGKHPKTIPSELVDSENALEVRNTIWKSVENDPNKRFEVRVHGSNEYPKQLRDAKYPVEVLYYKGTWAITELPSVAIVGSRKASKKGLEDAYNLAQLLAKKGYTVVSGLARGIDTAAHTGALDAGGRTISVIGTPITDYYPRENRALQDRIAKEHLLISQVPILRYQQQDWRSNRTFFPERNKTMSALTKATVIVEAGETSGTLIQARAAMEQGRKLFIMNECFNNPNISWPAKYEAQGAIRIRCFGDIRRELETI